MIKGNGECSKGWVKSGVIWASWAWLESLLYGFGGTEVGGIEKISCGEGLKFHGGEWYKLGIANEYLVTCKKLSSEIKNSLKEKHRAGRDYLTINGI